MLLKLILFCFIIHDEGEKTHLTTCQHSCIIQSKHMNNCSYVIKKGGAYGPSGLLPGNLAPRAGKRRLLPKAKIQPWLRRFPHHSSGANPLHVGRAKKNRLDPDLRQHAYPFKIRNRNHRSEQA